MQGRAAEALGAIGDRADADAISAMVQRHIAAGVLAKIEPTMSPIRSSLPLKPHGWGCMR